MTPPSQADATDDEHSDKNDHTTKAEERCGISLSDGRRDYTRGGPLSVFAGNGNIDSTGTPTPTEAGNATVLSEFCEYNGWTITVTIRTVGSESFRVTTTVLDGKPVSNAFFEGHSPPSTETAEVWTEDTTADGLSDSIENHLVTAMEFVDDRKDAITLASDAFGQAAEHVGLDAGVSDD